MTALQSQFAAIRQQMKSSLIERDTEVDLVLTALVARENLLFVGPPGTAKSLLLAGLMGRMKGAKKFSILMTKTTTPDEMFGPVSPAKLLEDRIERITTGRLPEAEAAFLDEIFKSSSACLNGLLTILNERQFDNGGNRMACPLRLAVSASNEWPGQNGSPSDELGAFFDRFTLRHTVRAVRSDAGLDRLLDPTAKFDPAAGTTFRAEDLDKISDEIEAVNLPADTRAKMKEILRSLESEGVPIKSASRRIYKGTRLAMAYAWLQGHDEVTLDDLAILAYAWWTAPEQEDICCRTVMRIANPTRHLVGLLLATADDVMRAVKPDDNASAIEAMTKLDHILRGDPSDPTSQSLASLPDSETTKDARGHVLAMKRGLAESVLM